MAYRPPIDADPRVLEDAANPDPVPVLAAKRSGPIRIAGFVLLFVVLSLLAFAAFLAIAIGVTILMALILPKAGFINLIAPVVGVGVASLCFGAASRFRKGMLKNRYGLFRRPPRDLGKPPARG
ncbi:MAG: hypothetical protein WB808_04505 [Candidatus Dormiibacterota bacterium]